MAASQPALFNVQEFTDAGATLVGGRLYTYVQGTTTFKTAYTDSAGTVPQTYTNDGLGGQYIALNARGELPASLYLGEGAYDISLRRIDGSTVWTRPAGGVGNLGFALSASTGSTLIGNGGETVAQSFEALQLTDYQALRNSSTPRKSVYITGVLGQSFAGIAGMFVRDNSDTTSADNGGTIIVRTDGVRYKRAGVERMNIQWFGAIPSQTINNSPMIQAAADAAKLRVVGMYIPSATAIGYRFDEGILLDSFFVGITGDSMAFSTLNYVGTGTAISFKTTSSQLGVYSNFQIQSGLSSDTIAARRAVSRSGIFWKCYGGQGEISNVKVLGFNGFGVRFEAVWDSRIDGLLVESCGGGGNYALGVGNGTDTSNHCTFTRLQVENSFGNAVYIQGLNMVVIGLHSERTVGDGSYTHVFLGDLTLIDGRIEGTSDIRVRVGIATGSMQNYKIFGGLTYFDWGARIINPARIIDCEFLSVIIPSTNLRQYDFTGGSMTSLNSSYAEKQTTLTGVSVSGSITLNGTGVRVNIYDGTVTGNIIQSAGGNNTVEAHDSDLAYFPTTQLARLYNCNIANTHTTPGGQKARSFNCIFSSEVVIQGNTTKWESQGCEYGNGATLGAGTPGWKFGKGDWVSSGAVSAGLLAPPSGSSATFANGEYCARLLKAVGQPKGWYCTTASPSAAFTSEGNL